MTTQNFFNQAVKQFYLDDTTGKQQLTGERNGDSATA